MNRLPALLFAAIGAIVLVSLGFMYLARPQAARTAQDAPDVVSIQDYSFQAATLRVALGTTVTWTNRDAVPHTVTSKNGDWRSGLLAQGQHFSRTFTEQGTYEYYCEPHPWMTGRIVVGVTIGEATPTPTERTTPDNRGEQLRQMMDRMHGAGAFDTMRQWMEERWGAGAFDAMLQDCPFGGPDSAPGQGMMNGSGSAPGQGMMDGGTTGGGMMGGSGMMGGGGMMGGPGQR
ncbi:MAG TPA: cupredoxin family copper-binding protein [Dehalococcoidia bacterium]|nr:cupredoxin family copper-binding protein [Dehalococcoidia bacterium]